MSGRARTEFCPVAALEVGRGLPFELRCAFRILLELMATVPGGLVRDDRYIAGCLGLSLRPWRRIESELISRGLIFMERGFVRSAAFDRVFRVRTVPDDWRRLRAIVFARDGERCRYCSSQAGPFEVDHVFPRSRDGSDAVDNLVVACRACNRSKSDRTPEEWIGEVFHAEA